MCVMEGGIEWEWVVQLRMWVSGCMSLCSGRAEQMVPWSFNDHCRTNQGGTVVEGLCTIFSHVGAGGVAFINGRLGNPLL